MDFALASSERNLSGTYACGSVYWPGSLEIALGRITRQCGSLLHVHFTKSTAHHMLVLTIVPAGIK